jgi:hypothetical protein
MAFGMHLSHPRRSVNPPEARAGFGSWANPGLSEALGPLGPDVLILVKIIPLGKNRLIPGGLSFIFGKKFSSKEVIPVNRPLFFTTLKS